MKKDFIKNEKGAMTTLVIITVTVFMAILVGTYFTVTNNEKAQLKSGIHIQSIYEEDINNINAIYAELNNSMNNNMNNDMYNNII